MRNYKRKTERANINEGDILEALGNIQKRRMTLKEASLHYGIKYSTLCFRLKRVKAEMGPLFDDQDITLRMGMKNREKLSKNASRQVFLQHEENALVEYILAYSKLNYGLTMDTVRNLAYQFALSLNRKFPDNWTEHRRAGKDWAMRFLKRHRMISLRKPEDTSLVGNTVFNTTNLKSYYENLQTAMQQHTVEPSRIWKLSAVDLSIMLQATECASKENDNSVSIVGILNASGDYMPPVYIFPENGIHMEVQGVPDNAVTIFNEKGRMNSEGLMRILEHIKNYTAPSQKHPIILLLDHSSYLTIDALKMCRECGILIVSLPPQTKHQTQALELTVSDLFKAYCEETFNTWLNQNPQHPITLRNIVDISSNSISKSFSRQNIVSDFAKTGIYPLDRSKIFKDLETDTSFYEFSNCEMQNYCRACENKIQPEYQISIFTTAKLLEIFMETTSLPIHENDGLPKILCSTCYDHLLEAYNFRKMCSAAALRFQKMLSGNPKENDTLHENFTNVQFVDPTLLDIKIETDSNCSLDIDKEYPDQDDFPNEKDVYPENLCGVSMATDTEPGTSYCPPDGEDPSVKSTNYPSGLKLRTDLVDDLSLKSGKPKNIEEASGSQKRKRQLSREICPEKSAKQDSFIHNVEKVNPGIEHFHCPDSGTSFETSRCVNDHYDDPQKAGDSCLSSDLQSEGQNIYPTTKLCGLHER